jgi:hypothetical protein
VSASPTVTSLPASCTHCKVYWSWHTAHSDKGVGRTCPVCRTEVRQAIRVFDWRSHEQGWHHHFLTPPPPPLFIIPLSSRFICKNKKLDAEDLSFQLFLDSTVLADPPPFSHLPSFFSTSALSKWHMLGVYLCDNSKGFMGIIVLVWHCFPLGSRLFLFWEINDLILVRKWPKNNVFTRYNDPSFSICVHSWLCPRGIFHPHTLVD